MTTDTNETTYRQLTTATHILFEGAESTGDPPSRLPDLLRKVADYVVEQGLNDGAINTLHVELQVIPAMVDGDVSPGTRWEASLFYDDSYGK